jgi:hypothetical protein
MTTFNTSSSRKRFLVVEIDIGCDTIFLQTAFEFKTDLLLIDKLYPSMHLLI